MTSSTTEFDLVIFLMPWEIDAYVNSIQKIDSHLANDSELSIYLHVCLCVSEQIVDWSQSITKIETIDEKFKVTNDSLENIYIEESRLGTNSNVLGCVDWRRHHIEKKSSDRAVIWLDCDIVFPTSALSIIKETLSQINDTYFILTPQIPRMWDDTWDCLVHPSYANSAIGQYLDFDAAFIESNSNTSISISPKPCTEFKFAGGWLTTFSSRLLALIGLPEAFRPYGEEDTYMMNVCEGLRTAGWPVTQYVSRDMLVAQDLHLFTPAKKCLNVVYDKDKDVLYNKSIKQKWIDNTLLNLGQYRSG